MKNVPLHYVWVRRIGDPLIPWVATAMIFFSPNASAADVVSVRKSLQRNESGTTTQGSTTSVPDGVVTAATPSLTSAQERLNRASRAVQAVRAMQTAARNAALASSANSLKTGLPSVAAHSYGVANGLLVSKGVPLDLANPKAGEDSSLWKGADLPVLTYNADGSKSTVTVVQNEQQAVLNWESFNIGKSTELYFNQTAGKSDVGNWVAFNKVGVSGTPSQILGSIRAEGQVYVINPNGIIFGGSSQVNAHALVASSLPINDNLISKGLLNNPDSQFLFTAYNQAAGSNGTAAFTPTITDRIAFDSSSSYTLSKKVSGSTTALSVTGTSSSGTTTLVAKKDYVTSVDSSGKTSITLTDTGVEKLAGASASVTYTPAATQYGDVEVQAGAVLFSPTSADHVGGKIALIGPNVTNSGTLSSPDGQVILAAGLEAGFAAHSKSDPSIRGLDVYIGKVADASDDSYIAGVATNTSTTDTDGKVTQGVLETTDLDTKDSEGNPVDRPGNITIAGREINQNGLVSSLTSVSTNGSINLQAEYNAYSNINYKSTTAGSQPFLYTTGNSTGEINLGAGSLLQIMPSQSTTDTINRSADDGLALVSSISLVGSRVHMKSSVASGSNSWDDSDVAVIRAPNATVSANVGTWAVLGSDASVVNTFVHDKGLFFMDRGSFIDVGGTQGAAASVKENYVSAQLNGSELANSPAQRDGPLRGKTVVFDLRVHGPWDPTLNDGKGGYTWIGTQLADVSGWASLVQRTAAELTTAGGKININAGGGVVMQKGSSINVSGGWTNFEGATVATTQLLGTNGRVYDISQATAQMNFKGIYTGETTETNSKWGTTQTSVASLVPGTVNEAGYIQGGNGGSLSLTSASMVLDGNLVGTTWSGARQTLVKPAQGSQSLVAAPSALSLKFESELLDSVNQDSVSSAVHTYSPYAPNVTLQSSNTLAASDAAEDLTDDNKDDYEIAAARRDAVELSTDLVNKNGFGFLAIDVANDKFGETGRDDGKAYGTITLAKTSGTEPALSFSGASSLAGYLNTRDGSNLAALNLSAANIDLEGGISAPGGSIKAVVTNFSASRRAIESVPVNGVVKDFGRSADPLRGKVTVGKDALIDVSGSVLDYRNEAPSTSVVALGGGKIELQGYQVVFEEGSSLDVSGGVSVSPTASVSYGSAGAISIKALNEEAFEGAKISAPSSYFGASSEAYFKGYGGTSGGSFTLQAPTLRIMSQETTEDSLNFDGGFFSRGGFSSFNLSGQATSADPSSPAVLIGNRNSEGTTQVLKPVVTRYLADLSKQNDSVLQLYTPSLSKASDIASASAVDLTFAAKSLTRPDFVNTKVYGSLVLGSDTSIQLLPNAASKVKLSGDLVDIPGLSEAATILVPGGTISISADKDSTVAASEPFMNLHLGAKAWLSTSGTAVTYQDSRGNVFGSVLGGGSISLAGNLVAEKGSRLESNGATGVLSLTTSQVSASSSGSVTGLRNYVPTRVDSSGGSISFQGDQFLLTDATLSAKAGGSRASGGSLSVSSNVYYGALASVSTVSPSITLTADEDLLENVGALELRKPVLDADGQTIAISIDPVSGQNLYGAHLATSTFSDGGFSNLTFAGTSKVSGDVTLKAGSSISIGGGGALVADSEVPSSLTLDATYISLGSAFQTPLAVGQINGPGDATATHGSGILKTKNATLIDVGNLALRGFDTATLATAPGGSIRGAGALDVAGTIHLSAGQVYVPTALTFNVGAFSYLDSEGEKVAGKITVSRSGTVTGVPLSAGGTLNLFASEIDQQGVLRAPLGVIRLGGGSAFTDVNNGARYEDSDLITLGEESITSVSTVDYSTGKVVDIPVPYGINVKGTTWIDPTGTDISLTGPVAKSVTIAAKSIETKSGSNVDLSGGGDLYAYRFQTGTNGTKDILASTSGSFAVIPSLSDVYAPVASFSTASSLGGDSGYVSAGLKVGDVIAIDLGDGAGMRTYTLLPARYALLPGAYLVTPKGGTSAGSAVQNDKSVVTSGYRYNALDRGVQVSPVYSRWEVASGTVVRSRAQYDESLGNTFFPEVATANNRANARLSMDAGQLVVAATNSLKVAGSISGNPYVSTDGKTRGLGGLVDIVSNQNIVISDATSGLQSTADTLVLQSSDLSNFGAESLLIGGTRSTDASGTVVTAGANKVTVANSGDTAGLQGKDILLVAKESVSVEDGSKIVSNSEDATSSNSSESDDKVSLFGANGSILRVSSNASARVGRTEVSTAGTTASIVIASGAKITASNGVVAADSSGTLALGGDSTFAAKALAIGARDLALDFKGDYTGGGVVLGVENVASWQQQGIDTLSLLSYGAITTNGTGVLGGDGMKRLELHAAGITHASAGDVVFKAGELSLDNSGPGTFSSTAQTLGTARFEATGKAGGTGVITLGAKSSSSLQIVGFTDVGLQGSSGIYLDGSGGVTAKGGSDGVSSLTLAGPVLAASAGSKQSLKADGVLSLISKGEKSSTSPASGVGVDLNLQGASLSMATSIVLPSGKISMTADKGDLSVTGAIDVSGTSKTVSGSTEYTSGGVIQLTSTTGNVTVSKSAILDVSAAVLDKTAGTRVGDAGTLSISAVAGGANLEGILLGTGGLTSSSNSGYKGGNGGVFRLDTKDFSAASLASLNSTLNDGGFTLGRDFRIRSGDVVIDGTIRSHHFALSADSGSVLLKGSILASGDLGGSANTSAAGNDSYGNVGGEVRLSASGGVALAAGSLIDVSAADFDAAGKGGNVTLAAGVNVSGQVDRSALLEIRDGSTVDLSVDSIAGDSAATEKAAALGKYSGTLRLRAPQLADASDVQIAAIGNSGVAGVSAIKNASSVIVEGVSLFSPQDGSIDSVKTAVLDNAAAFAGGVDSSGTVQAGHSGEIKTRLLGANSGLASDRLHVQPGAEIYSEGDLTLSDAWDLSTYRFGSEADSTTTGAGEPGTLTLRTGGNLVFKYGYYDTDTATLHAGSLSDGFAVSSDPAEGGLWQAKLLAAGSRSWSYNLVAGADLASADILATQSGSSGSILVGSGAPKLSTSPDSVTRTSIVPVYFQTLRTGTGDISLRAAKDIQLLNPLATIYTAGTQVANPTSIVSDSDFDLPSLAYNFMPNSAQAQTFGESNAYYPVQYSMAGGNVSLGAGGNILRSNSDGTAYSSAELPTNWLYRRGYVTSNGSFGQITTRSYSGVTKTEKASTSWWVDFSNFFQDVGALGGGNVSLSAGGSIVNVSASSATNARVTKQITTSSGVDTLAAHQVMVELGGGNVSLKAGADLNAGAYYAEKGNLNVSAGGDIKTNSTRVALLYGDLASNVVTDSSTWLPTTFFLGKGSVKVSADGDVLMGSVANPFLLPQGVNNSYYQRTYFSTFASDSSVSVSSLGGDIKFQGAKGPFQDGSLWSWYAWNESYLRGSLASTYQPWLLTTESSFGGAMSASYQVGASLMPGSLKASAYSGSILLNSDLTLSPSKSGNLELFAADSVQGLLPTSLANPYLPASSTNLFSWTSAKLNLSDASPERIPGVLNPLGFTTGTRTSSPSTPNDPLGNLAALFNESGATSGTNTVLETQLALHGTNSSSTDSSGSMALHAGDATTMKIATDSGSISGFTLFSAKAAQISSGQDLVDVGLYLQNANGSDVSVVTAANDIRLYDPKAPSRLQAIASGSASYLPPSQSGDIQISGPGSLEVLAGRNLEFGAASLSSSDGTNVGISSIGKTRNPYLPYDGADIYVASGLSSAGGLASANLDYESFISAFLDPGVSGNYSTRTLPALGKLMGFTIDDKNPTAKNSEIWAAFEQLSEESRRRLVLKAFYVALRDAGRDRNDSTAENYGNFNAGYTAIATLFDSKVSLTNSDSTGFVDQFLNPNVSGNRSASFLPVLGKVMNLTTSVAQEIWTAYQNLSDALKRDYAIKVFAAVLREAAQKQRSSATLKEGGDLLKLAIASLFDEQSWRGDISMDSRSIKTTHGGNISIFAPGGGLSLGTDLPGAAEAPPGIVTEHGGDISIFTHRSVDLGVERIFTLRGGSEIIWSSAGNIAAGKSSKTVQSAPPTEVLIDPQSADIKTDLAGLATGGGIGVLTSVAGVAKGDVDLIAPAGAIDAGDAGIRASGNLNIAAPVVLNAGNIQAGGSVAGTPQAPASPNIGALTSASNVSAAASSGGSVQAKESSKPAAVEISLSLITVEVTGYGGDSDADADDEDRPKESHENTP